MESRVPAGRKQSRLLVADVPRAIRQHPVARDRRASNDRLRFAHRLRLRPADEHIERARRSAQRRRKRPRQISTIGYGFRTGIAFEESMTRLEHLDLHRRMLSTQNRLPADSNRLIARLAAKLPA